MIDISCIICKVYSLRLGSALLGPCPTCITRKRDRMQKYNNNVYNTTVNDCKLIFNMINYKNSIIIDFPNLGMGSPTMVVGARLL